MQLSQNIQNSHRYLDRLNADMKNQGRHIILLVDNAPSHIYDPKGLSHVRVEFLEPNMTSHIQPLDAGIIHAFKATYRRLYISLVLDRDEEGQAEIYRIDQLTGMRLAMEAWGRVTQTTVANCWRHTGILDPYHKPTHGMASDPSITQAESDLELVLAKLMLSENVTAKNCVSAQEFMDVDGEGKTEDEWSFDDFIEQQQLDAREANGEHIEEMDVDPEPEVCEMTLLEACSAVTGLERLMHSRVGEVPDEARAFLSKLKRYIRREFNSALQQRSITSYFK